MCCLPPSGCAVVQQPKLLKGSAQAFRQHAWHWFWFRLYQIVGPFDRRYLCARLRGTYLKVRGKSSSTSGLSDNSVARESLQAWLMTLDHFSSWLGEMNGLFRPVNCCLFTAHSTCLGSLCEWETVWPKYKISFWFFFGLFGFFISLLLLTSLRYVFCLSRLLCIALYDFDFLAYLMKNDSKWSAGDVDKMVNVLGGPQAQ